MPNRRAKKTSAILTNAATTGFGSAVDVKHYDEVILAVSSTGGGNATLKFYGSVSETEPDWSSAASPSNHYAPQAFADYDDAIITAGSTGFVMSGTDADNIRNLMVNVDGIDFINVDVDTYSAGNISVTLVAYTK